MQGGFVGLKIYSSPRYTVDLDAVLSRANLRNTLDRIRQIVEKDFGDSVWFQFESENDLATQGEYGGIRIVFRTGIGEVLKNLKRAQKINFDLGIGDLISPGPITIETQELLGKDSIRWRVYPIETIIAEKIHALVDRGSENSRSKDVYDLFLFLPKADSKTLQLALEVCFNYRETELPKDLPGKLKKINLNLLTRGWTTATAAIRSAPSCEEAFQTLMSEIRRLLGSKKS